MTNDFSPDVRYLMLHDFVYRCLGCGRNHANCLHHIFGRGLAGQDYHASIFNAAPMNNNDCHLARHGYWSTDEGKKHLLKQVIERLNSIDYELNALDHKFLKYYAKEFNRLGLII